jgi:hypothetical protein
MGAAASWRRTERPASSPRLLGIIAAPFATSALVRAGEKGQGEE